MIAPTELAQSFRRSPPAQLASPTRARCCGPLSAVGCLPPDLSTHQPAHGNVRAPAVGRLDLNYPTVRAHMIRAEVNHIGRVGGCRANASCKQCHGDCDLHANLPYGCRLLAVHEVVASAWAPVQSEVSFGTAASARRV